MANPKSTFVCTECGWTTLKWAGRCGECQQWGTVIEKDAPTRHTAPARVAEGRAARPITEIEPRGESHTPTGIAEFDRVLVAVGRRANGDRIGAEAAGVAVDARGQIAVDAEMRSNVPHIFAIGDVVGQPMLAHKAMHEGKVAAEVAAGELFRSIDEPRISQCADNPPYPADALVAAGEEGRAWVAVVGDEVVVEGQCLEECAVPGPRAGGIWRQPADVAGRA